VGRLVFDRHRGRVVVFGRIISIPGLNAAFLAGVNRMAWNGASAVAIIVSLAWIRRHARHPEDEADPSRSGTAGRRRCSDAGTGRRAG
jgi:hypothetical protein